MIMRSEKGFIRPFVAWPKHSQLEQEATLARESRQEVLSHSDNLSTHPPTQDREMNREREGERKTGRKGDRDSGVEKIQRAPSLHYTGYLVQTVCQFRTMK